MRSRHIIFYLLILLSLKMADAATMFTLINNTHGRFPDNQIYWAIIGRQGDQWVHVDKDGTVIPMAVADNVGPHHLNKHNRDFSNYFHTLSEVKSIPISKIGSSRVFISLGSPMYFKVMDNGYAGADVNNPTDPNLKIFFDFVEFTIDDRGFHGNTSQVDAFGFPLMIELTDQSGQVRKAGHIESRSSLFSAFKRETPREFASCVREPYRIVSPNAGGFGQGKPNNRYFDSYLTQVWQMYATEKKTPGGWTGKFAGNVLTFKSPSGNVFSTPKPNTQEGNGVLATNPQFCAAINRHVLADPADWNDPTKYYKEGPANFYAKFWHDHGIDGKAYGFCYDDVNSQSSYIEAGNPTSLNITVSWD